MEMRNFCLIHFFLLVYAELAGTHVDKEKKATTKKIKC